MEVRTHISLKWSQFIWQFNTQNQYRSPIKGINVLCKCYTSTPNNSMPFMDLHWMQTICIYNEWWSAHSSSLYHVSWEWVVYRSNQPTEMLLKNLDTNIQNIEKFQNSSDFSGIGKYGSIRIAISTITPFRDALDLIFSQWHSFKLLFWLIISQICVSYKLWYGEVSLRKFSGWKSFQYGQGVTDGN